MTSPLEHVRHLRAAIVDALCMGCSDEVGGRLREGLRRARGDAHPEDRCEYCWGPFEPWTAPAYAWGMKTGRTHGGPILCKPCFRDLPVRLSRDVVAAQLLVENRPYWGEDGEDLVEYVRRMLQLPASGAWPGGLDVNHPAVLDEVRRIEAAV